MTILGLGSIDVSFDEHMGLYDTAVVLVVSLTSIGSPKINSRLTCLYSFIFICTSMLVLTALLATSILQLCWYLLRLLWLTSPLSQHASCDLAFGVSLPDISARHCYILRTKRHLDQLAQGKSGSCLPSFDFPLLHLFRSGVWFLAGQFGSCDSVVLVHYHLDLAVGKFWWTCFSLWIFGMFSFVAFLVFPAILVEVDTQFLKVSILNCGDGKKETLEKEWAKKSIPLPSHLPIRGHAEESSTPRAVKPKESKVVAICLQLLAGAAGSLGGSGLLGKKVWKRAY
ncbi:hypothetical protein KCU98_g7, partial [Aureobasidium melanogenum]